MPQPTYVSSQGESRLEIDADLRYQTRTWRMQRIGWIAFLALIAAALLGLFGAGLLSGTSAGLPSDDFRIEYERLARQQAPTEIVVHADARHAKDGEIGIVLSGDVVRHMELQSTMPPADGSSLTPAGTALRFAVQGEPGELVIVLHVKPQGPGLFSSRIGPAGGPLRDLHQLVYP